MAQKFVEGINNHEKLSKFSYNKFEKRSPLSQLQALYNVEPARPFLSVQLPGISDVLDKGKVSGIHRLPAASKQHSQRHRSAPVWIKVPDHTEMWESCALSEVPKPRRVVFSLKRPNTVPQQPLSKSSKKTDRESARNQIKPTLYRFKPLNGKTDYSRESIELSTALIKEQWDSRERQYIKSGVYARGKPEAKDQELLQWFTFEGDSPGALLAFTKDHVEDNTDKKSKFSIEANVGKQVAAQLGVGGKVRIGANGKLLHGPAVEPDEYSIFHDKCDEILTMTRGSSQKHEPLYPPLCWNDLEKDAKVLVSNITNGNALEEELNRSEPVVYNKTPKVKPYVPLSAQPDDGRLSSLLLHKPVNKQNKVETSLTYEDILKSQAPDSSREEKISRKPVPTRENSGLDPPVPPYSSRMNNHKSTKQHQPSAKLVTNSVPASIKTPNIPEEVKSGIQRQVTMPAYKIIIADKTPTRVAGRPNTGQAPHERVATPIRPPKYTPAYNSGGGTTPTISHNGMQGDKSYVTLTTPLNQAFRHEQFPIDFLNRSKNESGSKISHHSDYHRVNNTPANMSSITLVGKAPPVEKMIQNPRPPKKIIFQTEEPKRIVTEINASETDDITIISEEVEAPHYPSRLAISIPAVDMISASSAAVNSLTDFRDFDSSPSKSVEIMEEILNMNRRSSPLSTESTSSFEDADPISQRDPPSVSFDDNPVEFSISVDIGVRASSANSLTN